MSKEQQFYTMKSIHTKPKYNSTRVYMLQWRWRRRERPGRLQCSQRAPGPQGGRPHSQHIPSQSTPFRHLKRERPCGFLGSTERPASISETQAIFNTAVNVLGSPRGPLSGQMHFVTIYTYMGRLLGNGRTGFLNFIARWGAKRRDS